MTCPLCNSSSISVFSEDKKRTYFKCLNCSFVFVDRDALLSLKEEKDRYDLHDNTISNKGYVNYLTSVVKLIDTVYEKDFSILDYGSGENAVLSTLLKQSGKSCCSYDPVYNIGMDCLDLTFDIIVLCEVIEHLHDIDKEMVLIESLLKEKGILIIRTEFVNNNVDFDKWWYKEDPTHINFFSSESMDVLANKYELSVEHKNPPFIILKN